MAWIDPLSWRRLRRRTAPRTIYKIEAAVTSPSRDAAAIWRRGTFHTSRAKRMVIKYATGIARVAGFLSTTIRTNTERMGNKASADRIPKLMFKSIRGIYKTTIAQSQIFVIFWGQTELSV
jgi:hypothetical protein